MLRIVVFSAILASVMSSCNDNLTRGLEEEKSYTRNAMERYRKDPHFFKGVTDALENWSRMDFVGIAVVQHDSGHGNWAKNADQLPYIAPANQKDTNNMPYCVVRTKDAVTVIGMRAKGAECGLGKVVDAPPTLRSGDLDFSGKGYDWVYVLRR